MDSKLKKWFKDKNILCVTSNNLPEDKTHISIRIDTDVLEWFKQFGSFYQTRINYVLREFMEDNIQGGN